MAAPDLARTRFSCSPLWEAVASLRVLAGCPASVHRPWVAEARERTRGMDLSRLLALVPPSGHVADFLTPTPSVRHPTFSAELQAVRTASGAAVTRDLDHLLSSRPTPEAAKLLTQARRTPRGFASDVAADLRAYWHACLAPHWERLRGLDEADIGWRLAESALGGPYRVLSRLHPRVDVRDSILHVHTACACDEVADPAAGLVLVPCAFAWPDVLFLNTPDSAPTLGYAPRGVATLWKRPSERGESPLASLIGRSRAAILELLDVPMTTQQLSGNLGCAPPTISVHLRVLRRAGMVSSDRRGKWVFYDRTALGRQVLR